MLNVAWAVLHKDQHYAFLATRLELVSLVQRPHKPCRAEHLGAVDLWSDTVPFVVRKILSPLIVEMQRVYMLLENL